FMEQHEGTREFRARLADFLRFLVPQYVAEGKSYLTIAIGCTGGRHRSVMMAESLRRCLDTLEGVRLRVRHRDIDLGL
ncbi:MAG: RNase adaptor protein RapZ, partial [Bacteroidales bacterium]